MKDFVFDTKMEPFSERIVTTANNANVNIVPNIRNYCLSLDFVTDSLVLVKAFKIVIIYTEHLCVRLG